MGCTGSKDAKPQPANEPKASTQPQPSAVGRKCPFCAKIFAPNELNTHTVTCPQRQVMCHHSWCRKIVKQSELQQHMSECLQGRKLLCPKCGESFAPPDLSAHRTACDVVQCQHCPERVIPRMIKYCPNTVLGKLQFRVGPFASDRLREKFLGTAVTSPTSKGSPSFARANSNNNLNATSTFGPLAQSVEFGSPLANSRASSQVNLSASVQGKANIHFQVARIQHLWRWAKAKAALEDLLFRMVYKELDNKKETFSIFKAHDHKFHDDDRSRAKRNAKTAAPVQAVGATAGHYFPSAASTPITVDIVHRVIEDYTRRIPLPYHAVWRVLTESHNLLKALPNINRLSPPEGARQLDGRWRQGGKVVVVGDLHGQLQDLLCILQDNGIPSDRCLYVFNGDFVDRGHNGVEILVVLLLLLITFPNYVSLNRGNHECEYMNEEYGFDLEVQTKYDRNIYKLMQRVFCALPLATLIGDRVFIVHAGLPRRGSVTFEDIDLVQRFRQIPMPELAQPEEDEIFQDLTWSDPKPEKGWSESDRGVGCHFGPDVTEAFCATNNIELVIRSHEECAKGYEIHHGGKLLTVFSCSNYDGAGSNMGAVLFLFGTSAEWSQHSYTCTEEDYIVSDAHPAEKFAGGMNPVTPYSALGRTMSATSFGATFVAKDDSSFGHFCASLLGSINMFVMDKDNNLGILQPWHSSRRSRDDVLGALRERIFDRRHRLLAYFTKLDRTQKGSIWKMEWVETLNVVLNLDIPWFFLRPSLTHTEPISDRIRYVSFLARFRTAVSDLYVSYWATTTLAQLHYSIFNRKRHPVAKVLAEKTEPLGYIEFNALIHQVSEALTDNETFHLYLYLANDGKWNSFITGPTVISAMEAAVTTFENNPEYDDTSEAYLGWDLSTMDQLAHIIVRVGAAQLHKVFKLVVKDTPISSFDVFQDGLTSLGRGLKRPLELRPKVVKVLWDYLQKHCLEPDVGPTVDELIMAFTVRDFTALSERRDAYHEVIDCLLGDRSGTMHRKYSTTFMGFGPTPPVEFSSPIPGTLQPPWSVAQPTMILSNAPSNGPLMPPPQDLGRSLEDTPVGSTTPSGNSPVPRGPGPARRNTMVAGNPQQPVSTSDSSTPDAAGGSTAQTPPDVESTSPPALAPSTAPNSVPPAQ